MFGGQSAGGAPSGAGELLFSNGGLNRNESGSSGGNAAPQAVGPAGLGSGASSFDLSSDFPTLGGGGGAVGGPGVAIGGGGGLAGALRQQQMLQAQQQQQQQYRIATAGQPNINIAAEDFPALPGSGPGSGDQQVASQAGGAPASGSSMQQRGTNGSNPTSNVSSPFLGSRSGSGAGDAVIGAGGAGGISSNGSNPLLNGLAGGLAGLSIGGDSGSGGARPSSGSVGGGGSNNPSSSSVAATAAIGADGAAGSAINSDFGLLGLLSIIRMTDSDRNALALGDDLAALGLDMKSKDKLTDTFGGPFTDKPASSEPNYHIPMCYYMNPPALKTGHLSKFTLEILFYIFYAMPKDVLQAYSAQELYSREWRYHVDLKLWFKRAAPGDGVDLSDGSAKYIYFDFQTWDRRHFSGNVQQIVGGFLSEDDIRVKFPSSSS
mmetsp:Transcript_2399/g.4999  ORF Transcript_2399/g.4999 Transcript_2399/m.4999 type:complete len:434 (-) Transcript_2399:1309-2610(-)